ncbi:MAG: replication-associated recombination protein A [Flavobacteriales bacterium]|nr:replication-associated recombination protein A [Flavobacteriales bacterium]
MNKSIPLAERMRPKSLDDYMSQEKLVGSDGILRKTLSSGLIPSCIFWGPPGVGKTTLANLLAQNVKTSFFTLSAINSGVKEVREIIQQAEKSDLFNSTKPILFIDEIHRFSKSQQDSLLGAVERGTITLIGATTENPSFEVIPALLSRCQVYVLESLKKDELKILAERAISKDEILAQHKIELKEFDALYKFSGGDARKLLNVLELVFNSLKEDGQVQITDEAVEGIIQNNIVSYDKMGEQHYDVISAFIKSVRGSDPNAAVYWLARMIVGGEDPKFIARRLLILASEDIGIANPTALVMATNCFQAVQMIGYPECEIILSQTTVYLASSPKSNSTYMAIKKAKSLVQQTGALSVPLHLRNAPTELMKDLDYGKNYRYAHDFSGNWVNQEYMPDEISGESLYIPGQNTRENQLKSSLQQLWKDKYKFES